MGSRVLQDPQKNIFCVCIDNGLSSSQGFTKRTESFCAVHKSCDNVFVDVAIHICGLLFLSKLGFVSFIEFSFMATKSYQYCVIKTGFHKYFVNVFIVGSQVLKVSQMNHYFEPFLSWT